MYAYHNTFMYNQQEDDVSYGIARKRGNIAENYRSSTHPLLSHIMQYNRNIPSNFLF